MQDFLLDDDGDIMTTDNYDFVIGRSDEQHQELLLTSEKGEWHESPIVGCGLSNYLNDENIDGMCQEIIYQFVKDGQTVSALNYDEQTGNLNYDANYNS